MAPVTRTQIKEWFETLDIPTELQFVNTWDSFPLLSETAVTFDTQAIMLAARPVDKQLCFTRGHTSVGDGGGWEYVYYSTGRTGITADGGFYLNGAGTDDYFEAQNRDVANVRVFGALGDGSTDDYTAIQAAADSSAVAVYYPPGGNFLTGTKIVPAANQVHFGDGTGKITANGLIAMEVTNAGVRVRGIHFVAQGTSASENVLNISGTNDCRVEQCKFDGALGNSVNVNDASEIAVLNNRFINAVQVAADSDVNAVLSDIRVGGASENINISDNHCVSGAGIGIEVFGGTGGIDEVRDVSITNNHISDCRNYGINVYRQDITAGGNEIDRVLVSGNVITNIKGDLENSITSDRTHGAGIYLQAVDHFTCVDNVISYVNLGTVNFGSLVPGGVACNDCTNGTIARNMIDNSSAEGVNVAVQDKTETIAVYDNNIRNSTRSAIELRVSPTNTNFRAIEVRGNRMKDCAARGFFVNKISGEDITKLTLTDNVIDSTTGGSGIEIPSGVDHIECRGNEVYDASNKGIDIANVVTAQIHSNYCRDVSTNSFVANTGVTDVTFTDNVAELSGADTGQIAFSIDGDNFTHSIGNKQIGFGDAIDQDLNDSSGSRIVNILDYGAVADGVTDDTAALTAAAAAGNVIVFPAGTYLTTNATGFTLSSNKTYLGRGGATVKRGAGSDRCFSIGAQSNVIVDGFTVDQAGDATTQYGLLGTGNTNVTIRNCHFKNHLGSAIEFSATNTQIKIVNNTFTDAITVASSAGGSAILDDIRLKGNISDVVVRGNLINSTAAVGVALFNTTGPDEIRRVIIAENHIRGSRIHAIYCYTTATPDTDAFQDIEITGNLIDNVLGDLLALASRTQGAGIQLQQVEHVAVTSNTISRTNVNTDEWTSLTPGAIGVNQCENFLISDNQIRDAKGSGVDVIIDDEMIIGKVTNNQIYTTVREGLRFRSIKASDGGVLIVSENTTNATTRAGCEVEVSVQPGQLASGQFLNNTFANSTTYGLRVKDSVDHIEVSHNFIDTCTQDGMELENFDHAKVIGNTVYECAAIAYDTTAGNVFFQGNKAEIVSADTGAGHKPWDISSASELVARDNRAYGYSEAVDRLVEGRDRFLIEQQVFEYSTLVASGDGKAYLRIGEELNGANLISAAAQVGNVQSTSGTPTIQLARMRAATPGGARTVVDMLSTRITIDANEWDSKDAASAAVINASNDDVATGDLIRVDVDVTGTGTEGLFVTLGFQ